MNNSNFSKIIIVLSLDINDFLYWRKQNNLIPTSLDCKNRFINNSILYICINKSIDLCSVNFDEVIETDNAKLNKEYNEILTMLKAYE